MGMTVPSSLRNPTDFQPHSHPDGTCAVLRHAVCIVAVYEPQPSYGAPQQAAYGAPQQYATDAGAQGQGGYNYQQPDPAARQPDYSSPAAAAGQYSYAPSVGQAGYAAPTEGYNYGASQR